MTDFQRMVLQSLAYLDTHGTTTYLDEEIHEAGEEIIGKGWAGDMKLSKMYNFQHCPRISMALGKLHKLELVERTRINGGDGAKYCEWRLSNLGRETMGLPALA